MPYAKEYIARSNREDRIVNEHGKVALKRYGGRQTRRERPLKRVIEKTASSGCVLCRFKIPEVVDDTVNIS